MRLTIHNENHVRQNQINPLAQGNDPGVWEPDTTSKPWDFGNRSFARCPGL